MFSEADMVVKSLDEMRSEVESLIAESEKLKLESESLIERSDRLRIESVETRPKNQDLAESLWEEAENLRSEGREALRLSIEKAVRAGEIKHRIEIRAQIETMDPSDDIWQRAAKASRL
jgi:regulator of replication initiation timing